jgi:hypothetical protein
LLNNQANELGIENIFLNSAEYLVSHDTPSAFVTGVYLDVLGRSPTINEEASWQGVLAAFGSNTVTTSIISSAESLTRIVANDYTTYLNRTPDSGGLNLWLSQLQTGRGTVETVAESILGSAEYAAKH